MTQHSSSRFALPDMTARAALLAGIPGINAGSIGNVQGETPFEIVNYELENGLQVILVADHSAPTVAVSIWYKVGGANDPAERSGFAHLFEHMMFQGSAHVPRGRHADWISAAGGNHNASTGIDRTNYFEELPAHQLPLALWLEADRMRSLVVDEQSFQREREVVKEEYHQRIQNQPYGKAFLTLQTIALDYGPYQRPVIGSIEDLDRANVDEVRQFHDTYYTPNNAVLTVAGDIDLKQTQALIARYFGDIPRQAAAPALPAYHFTLQQQEQEVTIEDKLARVPALFMVYRIPPRGHRDYYAAELLSAVLGDGNSSRLARALVDSGLATIASSTTLDNLGPSLFYAVLIPNPGVDIRELARIYDAELARVRNESVTGNELTKAINGTLTLRIGGLQDALGLAESVQEANLYLHEPNAVLAELEHYRAITAEDIQRIVDEYLRPEQRNTVNVVLVQAEDSPMSGSQANVQISGNELELEEIDLPADESAGEVDEGHASAHVTLPAPLPFKEFSVPEITEGALDNGLWVIVAPQRSLPYLTVQLILPGGESAAPAELSGLSEFTADLLPRGTQTRTAQEIAQTIEEAGGDLSTSAYDNLMKASITVLSDYTDLALEILEDVTLHPIFPEAEVAIQRQRALTGLQAALASPTEIGHRAFNAIIYGDHPYGHNATEQSLAAITRADIAAYYRQQLNPQTALLVFAGDISVEEALAKAAVVFGNWTADTSVSRLDFPEPPTRTEQAIYLVDRPGSSQVEVVIGHLGLTGASPDRYAVQVTNQVFGADSSSRLFRNLREEKGYTYGVYSGFSLPRGMGKFVIHAAVRNEVIVPAIREILAEMARIRKAPVPEKELSDAKSYLTGSFALRLETVRDLANQIISLKMRDLPLSDLRVYPQAIGRINDETVLNAAQKYIHPDKAAIVVVGDASRILPDLQTLAPVKLVNTEGAAVS